LTLVIDANVATPALLADRLGYLGDRDLVAPPLLWSEVSSALHRGLTQGKVSRDDVEAAMRRLEGKAVAMRNPRALRREAWRIADAFGWGRTYDAEFVALASLLRCRMVTLDGRLRRGADRLGFVVLPGEL